VFPNPFFTERGREDATRVKQFFFDSKRILYGKFAFERRHFRRLGAEKTALRAK
jgi:hypothetical protein